MIAFEILVNGHHIQTISVGEFGMLTARLMAHRILRRDGSIDEDIHLWPHGLAGAEGDHVEWGKSFLKAGDTVTIRIMEGSGGTT